MIKPFKKMGRVLSQARQPQNAVMRISHCGRQAKLASLLGQVHGAKGVQAGVSDSWLLHQAFLYSAASLCRLTFRTLSNSFIDIECSVMASDILGQKLDLHSG